MRLLLDTHVFLWWISDDPKLKPKLRKAIANPANDCFFSVASAWEIAIKTSLGKLDLGQGLEKFLPQELATNQFQLLPLSLTHTLRVATLPWHHHDPFDRLLIAQCQAEGLTLATLDAALAAYDVPLLR